MVPCRIWWRSPIEDAALEPLRADPAFDLVKIGAEGEPPDGPLDVLVDGTPSDAALDVPGLRHVIVPYAGIRPSLQAQLLARPHLTLHNSHFNAGFVAQHALALVLAGAGRLVRYDQALRRGDWRGGSEDAVSPDRWGGPPSVHLAGKRALLVGYGAIGKALHPLLEAVGLEVHAVRRTPAPSDPVPTSDLGGLHEALAASDVVVVSLPGTPATQGVFGAAAFSALRDGAVFVNVGRGAVMDEDATWEALNARKFSALALDVWWTYPDETSEGAVFPSRHPFHTHPDVLMSPHRANAVDAWRTVRVDDVHATLRAIWLEGDLAHNRVEPSLGY